MIIAVVNIERHGSMVEARYWCPDHIAQATGAVHPVEKVPSGSHRCQSCGRTIK